MVRQIEDGLEANPDDLEGWRVLSQTYLSLGRYADAEKAYLRVLKLGGENAVVYAALADASALDAQGRLSGKPMEYVAQALELDPQQPQALWLAGLHAAQMGDNSTAKRYWEILLPLLSAMPVQQAELADILAQMNSETLLSDSTQEQTTNPDSNGTDSTVKQGNALMQGGISVSVEIDAQIKAQLDPQALVFVIARAIDGPRAPLAVKRYTIATLPSQVVLSDKDSMIAELRLSAFPEVEISARVSLSGQPIASAGDYQATPVRIFQDKKREVNLLINQQVK
jgi:cytochrome c-type biogenesis protein CcmH